MGLRGTADSFAKKEDGVEVVEYAVVASLLVGGLIVALSSLVPTIVDRGRALIDVIAGG